MCMINMFTNNNLINDKSIQNDDHSLFNSTSSSHSNENIHSGSTDFLSSNPIFAQNWVERFERLTISDPRYHRSSDRIRRKLGMLASRVAFRLSQQPIGRSSRFISDIIINATRRTCCELLDKIEKTKTVIAIYHPESQDQEIGHIHVYHICSYNQSHCRCVFLKGYNIKKRDPRRTPFVRAQFNTKFWTNFFFYYFKTPREFIQFQIGARSFMSTINQIRDLEQSQTTAKHSAEPMVEEEQFPCQDVDWENGVRSTEIQQNQQHVSRVAETLDRGYANVPGLQMLPDKYIQRRLNIQNQILNAIQELLVVPVESTCQVEKWLEHPVLSIFNQSDPEYKKACSLFNRRLQHMTFEQLRQLHLAHPHAIYLARNSNHYYNLEDSLLHVDSLLDYQYQTLDEKKSFLQCLFNVCERKIPKLNSIYLFGGANCGKTWFMDMVTSYYINVGHVKNFVRGQNFPLNDCVSRRILLWNEPSIMPSAFDSVKMLAGGDPCPCAVKYEGDGKISRTPLIFTANYTTFPTSKSVWTTRIATYKWQPCDYLKDCSKYPHPYTFALLIDKYVLNE